MGWLLDVLNESVQSVQQAEEMLDVKRCCGSSFVQPVQSVQQEKVLWENFRGGCSPLPTAEPEQPDPRAVEYARSLLVVCPGHGRKLHCWHCSRCGYAPKCDAWRKHYGKVKEFAGRGKPLSLLLLEELKDADR